MGNIYPMQLSLCHRNIRVLLTFYKPLIGTGSNTNFVLLGDLTSRGLGLADKADYFSDVVTVLMAKQENCIYKACPVEDCKKKIIDLNNGVYRCEKCNREHTTFKYRMLLSVCFISCIFNVCSNFFESN